MANEFMSIDDFELGKPLGVGRFGQVWLARHKKHNFLCAIKILNRSLFKDNIDVKNLRREIEVHLNMRNKYILNMYGYFYDSKRIYCALEWAPGGDLWKYLHDYGHLSEEKASRLVFQLSHAIKYLHDHNIIHRDIKPENILLGSSDKMKTNSININSLNANNDSNSLPNGKSILNENNFNIKLCDFGWSVFNSDKKRATFCGTAEYLPPEMCMDKSYDKSADIWCLGILAFELCTGATPFGTCKTIRLMKEKISGNDINFPAYLHQDTINFIKRCCEKNPLDRIGLVEILEHPFLTKYFVKNENNCNFQENNCNPQENNCNAQENNCNVQENK